MQNQLLHAHAYSYRYELNAFFKLDMQLLDFNVFIFKERMQKLLGGANLRVLGADDYNKGRQNGGNVHDFNIAATFQR